MHFDVISRCFQHIRFAIWVQKGFSTDLCTGLLKLVSSQYIHHGSKVRCALLDMSKAFDMVDQGQPFESLCQRNLPNPVVQGGVLSSRWFTVYIDKLLQRLQKLGVGCH